jgi:hypothetical protein
MGIGNHMKRIAEMARAPAEDGQNSGVIVRRQNDRATVDDASFFAGDLADRRAEELGVVVADGRDERGEGADDIRGIEAAAHPHFEHHDLASRFGEGDEGDQGQSFEICWQDFGALGSVAESSDGRAQRILADHRSVDHPALAQLDQMWRGVEARSVSRGVKD